MSKASKFRDQSVEDLRALHRDLSQEIFQLTNEMRITRKVEKPHLLREKRRDRARVLTILTEKEAL